jgi:hypothetical protein
MAYTTYYDTIQCILSIFQWYNSSKEKTNLCINWQDEENTAEPDIHIETQKNFIYKDGRK